MELQWPLIIFTLFIALSCGILGGMSILVLRGQGKQLMLTSLIAAVASLVIGGLGAFLHLEHWERIFNGFGHITSGITLELIGCVVMALVMVVWFVMLRGDKQTPKALAWVTLVVAIGMMVATADSYVMPARPAWGFSLMAFYVTNACLFGGVALWLITSLKKDEEAEKTSIQVTFVGAILQLVGIAIYAISIMTAKITDFGFYADPTAMTTAPTHIDSLGSIMLTGDGALMFWCSIACVIVALVCALVAKRKPEAAKTYMVISVIVAFAASILFRVLIYVLAFPLFLLY